MFWFLGLRSWFWSNVVHTIETVKNVAGLHRSVHAVSDAASVFGWSPEGQEAFKTLQSRLRKTFILALLLMKELFVLYTGAILRTMRAVFSNVQSGLERVICDASKLSRKTRQVTLKRKELCWPSLSSICFPNTISLVRKSQCSLIIGHSSGSTIFKTH